MSEKQRFAPVVPANSTQREFTLRALDPRALHVRDPRRGQCLPRVCKAGMTIAATYPAAVIGMAVLRLIKGIVLEENFARTVGSIGESVAAGAIFTIPAFVILQLWTFTPARTT